MNTDPLISVVIPTKNGEKTIDNCLKSIFSQQCQHGFEVIIIDSGSTDNTLKIAKQYPVKIHHISPQQFGHGRTRNLGVQLSRGEFIFFTVQDASLSTTSFFATAVKHFTNTKVAAVGGKQIVPHDADKNPLQWYRPVGKPTVQILTPQTYSHMDPREKFFYARLDNVAAMYRRDILLLLPFPDVDFGEDLLWADQALSLGWEIIIDHNLQVFHYHDYTNKNLRARRIQERKLAQKFGIKHKLSLLRKLHQLIRIFYLVLIKKNFVPRRKIHWLLYNLKLWWWE